MKKYIIIFISIIAISCSDNPIDKPERLLDEEEMENILYDIAVLQASQSYMANSVTSDIKISDYLYKKYDIDSTILFQNQKYYSADIKTFKKMYKNILEKIQAQKSEVDTIIARGKNISSSQIK